MTHINGQLLYMHSLVGSRVHVVCECASVFDELHVNPCKDYVLYCACCIYRVSMMP